MFLGKDFEHLASVPSWYKHKVYTDRWIYIYIYKMLFNKHSLKSKFVLEQDETWRKKMKNFMHTFPRQM